MVHWANMNQPTNTPFGCTLQFKLYCQCFLMHYHRVVSWRFVITRSSAANTSSCFAIMFWHSALMPLALTFFHVLILWRRALRTQCKKTTEKKKLWKSSTDSNEPKVESKLKWYGYFIMNKGWLPWYYCIYNQKHILGLNDDMQSRCLQSLLKSELL
jgi:hypothetical protein